MYTVPELNIFVLKSKCSKKLETLDEDCFASVLSTRHSLACERAPLRIDTLVGMLLDEVHHTGHHSYMRVSCTMKILLFSSGRGQCSSDPHNIHSGDLASYILAVLNTNKFLKDGQSLTPTLSRIPKL